MKQIIVMISMVLLGIAIGGLVMDFGESAEKVSDNVNSMIEQITSPGGLR
mgnify:CR=1 FL=1